jgi:hypothetical protein
VLGLLLAASTRADIQFDVFLGYDGVVPEASWFPIVIEVSNDGPTFTGVVEVQAGGGQASEGQARHLEVELPTGTLKRLTIPVFSPTRGYSSWDVRLLDERGKVRKEQIGLRPRRQISREVPLMGSLSRSATPSFRQVLANSEWQPASARLLPTVFPDNPLVLEAMGTLYLNSEVAPKLGVRQVQALLDWLNTGGHLIVGVEQISEVTSTPWLNRVFPCDLKEVRSVEHHSEIQQWLKRSSGTNVYVPRSRMPQNVPGMRRKRNGQIVPMTPLTDASSAGIEVGNPFADLADDFGFETKWRWARCGMGRCWWRRTRRR